MKKSILNLGIALNKTEQQTINGGSICHNSVHYSQCQDVGTIWSPSHNGSEYGTCCHFLV